MTSSQDGVTLSGITPFQMESTTLTATLFESQGWRLYETRQANRIEEQTVEELRKFEDGWVLGGGKPRYIRTPDSVRPCRRRGEKTSRNAFY
jgi:hypothetical protein